MLDQIAAFKRDTPGFDFEWSINNYSERTGLFPFALGLVVSGTSIIGLITIFPVPEVFSCKIELSVFCVVSKIFDKEAAFGPPYLYLGIRYISYPDRFESETVK